jgi:hypothetical protein
MDFRDFGYSRSIRWWNVESARWQPKSLDFLHGGREVAGQFVRVGAGSEPLGSPRAMKQMVFERLYDERWKQFMRRTRDRIVGP